MPTELLKSPAKATSSAYLVVDGRKIYCEESGEGLPVVTLHGFPDTCENMRRYLDFLSSDARIIGYDRLGSGRSDKPKIDYDLDFFVEELRQFLQAKHLPRAVLFGHAVGGTVALKFAARYPKMVAGLILLNTVYTDFNIQTGMDYLGAWFMHLPMVGEMMVQLNTRFATVRCLRLAFVNHAKITPEMVERYFKPLTTTEGRWSYLKTMRSIYSLNEAGVRAVIEEVRAHSIPCCVLWTEKDWSMPMARGSELAEILSAQFHSIADCGHSPHLELEDEDFRKEAIDPIRKFLKTLQG